VQADASTKTDQPQHAIVFVVDGLSPAFLGPYGNTWVESPAFNELAAQSVLIEHAISDSPQPPSMGWGAYRGFWNGEHALRDGRPIPKQLLDECRRRQVQTSLVTDQPEFAKSCESIPFDEVHTLPAVESPARAADISETRFAQLISQVIQTVESLDPHAPSCTWVHAASLNEIWDAPLDLVEELRSEEDPEADSSALPPSGSLTEQEDPDIVWARSVNYAAQVRVIDACLDVFFSAAASWPTWDEATLFALTATHGYPLGEHLTVGPIGAWPHTPLIHVPMLVRFPQQKHASIRLQAITQPDLLFATLAQWFELGLSTTDGKGAADLLGGDGAKRMVAVSSTAEAIAVRTPAWLGIEPVSEEALFQLFAKPGDRFDVNEVAKRCPVAVKLLRDELQAYQTAIAGGDVSGLPPLDESLIVWRD
jgi:hypothetical protein